MTCEECGGQVEDSMHFNDHVFCSSVCLEEWYENKRQERARR